jgi:hypothetical protein
MEHISQKRQKQSIHQNGACLPLCNTHVLEKIIKNVCVASPIFKVPEVQIIFSSTPFKG